MRSSLNDVAHEILEQQPIKLPRVRKKFEIPLVPLGEIATVGRDRRDLHDAFTVTSKACGYPAVWGHSGDETRTIAAKPNAELAPRGEPAPGRKRILNPDDIWAGAGRLMVAERLWLITHRCVSVALQSPALSNTWWSVALRDDESAGAIAMWLNSTIGLTTLLGIAEETRGPWIDVKKNKLLALPVLDISALSEAQSKKLEEGWQAISDLELAPIAHAAIDEVRALIDQKVGEVLEIPPAGLEALRSVFGAEPRLDEASGSLARKRAAKARQEGKAEQTVPLF